MSTNMIAIIILLSTFTFLMLIKVGIAYAIAISASITAIYLNFPFMCWRVHLAVFSHCFPFQPGGKLS